MIDEATQYQEVRGVNALQLLLARFISEELRPYSQQFPHDYFKELFRLYNKTYDPTTQRRPRYFSNFNIKYVYEMLPPQVWDKLDQINRPVWSEERQRADRKHHLHRYLTDAGLKNLQEHLQALIPVMKLSKDIKDFKKNFNLVFDDKLKKLERLKNEEQIRIEEYDQHGNAI